MKIIFTNGSKNYLIYGISPILKNHTATYVNCSTFILKHFTIRGLMKVDIRYYTLLGDVKVIAS